MTEQVEIATLKREDDDDEEKAPAQEAPLFRQRTDTKVLDLREEEAALKVQIGTMVKAAATVAAGVATGGGGSAMGLVDSLKGVELEMSFGKSEGEKEIVKHQSDDSRYLFLKITYSSKKKNVGVLGFRKTELEVKGEIYVAYMEGLNEAGRREVQALAAENAASAMCVIRSNIKEKK